MPTLDRRREFTGREVEANWRPSRPWQRT
ncbi:hypothetical protein MPC4_250042 [Methylocella tundrae]|uniref:Uncharacterized protein n=1 Tax=Methylocella tundrae TaxID=227605 RepID=A0A8B6M916_METTU|nr:hypothetical protein MPC1_1110005 [Methylocella tundrae]VTZ50534.1 hypothetical protein MPC4_250042 [Methylocella tundrae]